MPVPRIIAAAAGMFDAQEVARALYLLAAVVGLVGGLGLYLKWRRPYLAMSWASLALAAGGAVPSIIAQVDLPGVAQGGFWMESSPWFFVAAMVAAVAFAGLDRRSRHPNREGARPGVRAATSVGVGNAAATDHSASASGAGTTAIAGPQYNAPVVINQADAAIVDKLIGESRSVGQLQGQVARLETDLESERRLRQELEAALARTAQLADQGDTPARRAIDEARRSGDLAQLQAVLVGEADRRGREVLAGAADFLELCREIAAVAYLRGDIEAARKHLDLILRFIPDDRDAHNRLGLTHSLRGDWKAAEESYGRVLALSGTDLTGQAIAWGNLGVIYQKRGELDRAEETYRKSLAIEEKLGRRHDMAAIYGNLAVIYRTRGDLDQAEQMHKESLDINEGLGCHEGMASQYGNLGLIHLMRGDLDGAEEMHKKSLAIEEKLGRQQGIANQYGNLGLVYGRRGDLNREEEMHRKTLAIAEKLGDQQCMAVAYGNLGAIYSKRGDLAQAEKMYQMSLAIEEKLGRQEGMANQYGNLGLIYQTRGDARRARQLWTQARDLYARIGMTHMVANVQGWLDGLPP